MDEVPRVIQDHQDHHDAADEIDRIESEALYENHDRVRVFYVAGYKKKDGKTVSTPFDVMYLVQRRMEGPKIFGFITGDEMAVFRQYGLVNEAGEPA